jgi:predicted nucleotidyltransferase
LHLKIKLSESEFSQSLQKATSDSGIYVDSNNANKNYIDTFISENLLRNVNENNKIILCGNLNSLQTILPENIEITNKLKYELNHLGILINNKKRFYFEFIFKFESLFEYEKFKKKVDGYFYHLKDKNVFFLFENYLFGSFVEGKNDNERFYKLLIKSEKDILVEELISLIKSIFDSDFTQNIVLSNKFAVNNSIPDKGYYRKYVDLFYKYYDKNIILFFTDVYKFNFNNLLIEEYLVSEAIVNLLNERK